MNHSLVAFGGVILLAGILALLGGRRAPQSQARRVNDSRGAHLRLRVTDAWAFDHLCRAMTTILRARPGLRQLTIDLTEVPVLDASSTALLLHALRELEQAGVEARLERRGAPFPRDLIAAAPSAFGGSDSEPQKRTLH